MCDKIVAGMPDKAKTTAEHQCGLSIMKTLYKTHEHIMNLIGWKETGFIVQLFTPLYAQTLRQFIKGGDVSIIAGATIMLQLCYAVAWLHGCRITHRGIKPPNVRMTFQPLAVVSSDV